MRHHRFLVVRCCPKCGSMDVRRSHRRGLLEIVVLRVFLLRPFRCEDCHFRHYNLGWTRAIAGNIADLPPDHDEPRH